MVAMPVGVDQIFDRIGAEILDRALDLVGQRCELIVDQDGSVRTIGKADIATRAKQDSDPVRQRFGLDLYRGKAVAFLGVAFAASGKRQGRGGQQQGSKCSGYRTGHLDRLLNWIMA